MKSILSFDHYDVLETVYKYNPFDDEGDNEFVPSFKLLIKYKNEEKLEAALFFTIEIGDKNAEKFPIYLKAEILGVFSIEIDEEELTEEVKDDLYKKNALATLYPYMRSLVTDLSSKGSEMPLTLPPINIVAMIEQENVITEEYYAD